MSAKIIPFPETIADLERICARNLRELSELTENDYFTLTIDRMGGIEQSNKRNPVRTGVRAGPVINPTLRRRR